MEPIIPDTATASEPLTQQVLDALPALAVLLGPAGEIVAVNHAWNTAAAARGVDPRLVGCGCHYLKTCRDAVGPGSARAEETAAAIEQLLRGARASFHLEYACVWDDGEWWYSLRGAAIEHEAVRAVLMHDDITREVRPRVMARRRLASLTPREREVVELVAGGLSSEEIGEELGISINTAEHHRHAALRKASARNTAELVRFAIIAGMNDELLDPEAQPAFRLAG